MQDFVRRFRAKATKARQAQSRIKALERMELIAPAHIDSPFQFSIPETEKISDPLIVLEEADLGFCGHASWVRKESTDEVEDVIRIEGCRKPSIVTIEVGGAGETGTEEVIRGLHDSLRATSLALAEDVLPGAGSAHSRIAHAVRKAAESQGGRERLAMEAFARAMETIPATLVENAGGETLDRVLELRSIPLNEIPVGISQDGKIWEVDGVWHPRSVIENSLESATETAMGMLRIDQVISARGE